jgi:hypothetical protein
MDLNQLNNGQNQEGHAQTGTLMAQEYSDPRAEIQFTKAISSIQKTNTPARLLPERQKPARPIK